MLIFAMIRKLNNFGLVRIIYISVKDGFKGFGAHLALRFVSSFVKFETCGEVIGCAFSSV